MALFSQLAGKPLLLLASKNANPHILQGFASGLTELSNVFLDNARKWGFCKVGTQEFALEVDSIAEISFGRSANILQHPVESGQLLAYNKVRMPMTCQFLILIGGLGTSWRAGTSSGRAQALEWLEQNLNDTSCFDIVMPEKRYSNYTLKSYQILRGPRTGPSLLEIKAEFQEVLNMSEIYAKEQAPVKQNTENSQNSWDAPAVPAEQVQLSKR